MVADSTSLDSLTCEVVDETIPVGANRMLVDVSSSSSSSSVVELTGTAVELDISSSAELLAEGVVEGTELATDEDESTPVEDEALSPVVEGAGDGATVVVIEITTVVTPLNATEPSVSSCLVSRVRDVDEPGDTRSGVEVMVMLEICLLMCLG